MPAYRCNKLQIFVTSQASFILNGACYDLQVKFLKWVETFCSAPDRSESFEGFGRFTMVLFVTPLSAFFPQKLYKEQPLNEHSLVEKLCCLNLDPSTE